MTSSVKLSGTDRDAICSICVRRGSKGVAGKNIRPMHGKPLLAHTIGHAKQSGLFSCIAVSSDSQDILDIAQAYGADHTVRRPDHLATDTSAKPPAMRHCVESAEAQMGRQFELIVDLDATSPLRIADDICNAVGMLLETGAGNVITGTPSHRSPYFNMVEEKKDGTVGICKPLQDAIVRRQDAPACYDMNASIYVWNRRTFFEGPEIFRDDTRIYVMPPERSIDIDSELDWELVEFLMGKNGA